MYSDLAVFVDLARPVTSATLLAEITVPALVVIAVVGPISEDGGQRGQGRGQVDEVACGTDEGEPVLHGDQFPLSGGGGRPASPGDVRSSQATG
jgi:hypothetical protein